MKLSANTLPVLQALGHLITADVLVGAPSAFSQVAALYSSGVLWRALNQQHAIRWATKKAEAKRETKLFSCHIRKALQLPCVEAARSEGPLARLRVGYLRTAARRLSEDGCRLLSEDGCCSS